MHFMFVKVRKEGGVIFKGEVIYKRSLTVGNSSEGRGGMTGKFASLRD